MTAMPSMRELPAPEELLKPRDREPIIYVPPQTWHCLFCQPEGPDGSATSVNWIGPHVDGPHGRCVQCGQKYCLAQESSMQLRAGLPARRVEARVNHCVHCSPRADTSTPPNVAWRGLRGRCARCGQAYVHESAPPSSRAA
jgi:hypothetical protein